MIYGTCDYRSLRVGFDLDGVVYDFRKALSEYLVASGRGECSLQNALPHWDFYKGWGLTLEEFFDLYRAGVDDGYVLRVGAPLPGSVEAMHRVAAAGHTIHIVTDRRVASAPGLPAQHTAAWLAENHVPFDSLTLSSDKTAVPTDYFIDDRYENYLTRVHAGMSCHLLTRPWNANLGNLSTNRVATIDEFTEEILCDHPEPHERQRMEAG